MNIITDISPPIPCLAKSWFSSYGPKCCWPIKLQDSLNRGKKKEVNDKVYFVMEIKVFFKLILSGGNYTLKKFGICWNWEFPNNLLPTIVGRQGKF